MKISEEVMFLENAFDILNERYFESALPKIASDISAVYKIHQNWYHIYSKNLDN